MEGKTGEEVWECGTTTLLGGVLVPLDEGKRKDDPRWGFVVASVGDCKAYVGEGEGRAVMSLSLLSSLLSSLRLSSLLFSRLFTPLLSSLHLLLFTSLHLFLIHTAMCTRTSGKSSQK